MRSLVVKALFLLLTASLTVAQADDASSEVAQKMPDQPMSEVPEKDYQAAWRAIPLLTNETFYEQVVVQSGDSIFMRTDKSWFIAFYIAEGKTPQEMAPTWNGFLLQYGHKVNVARVDCASEEGRDLCRRAGVRSVLKMIFMPGLDALEGGQRARFVNFKEKPLTIEAFQDFALQGGYKEGGELGGWDLDMTETEKYIRIAKFELINGVDTFNRMCDELGILAVFPAPYHYIAFLLVISVPPIFMTLLFFCWPSGQGTTSPEAEEKEKPQHTPAAKKAAGSSKAKPEKLE